MAGGSRVMGARGLLLLAAAIAAVACGPGRGGDVPLADVVSGDLVAHLIQNGELRAAKTENITSPTWGKVSDVVREGSEVKMGDPVVWIETQEVEQDVKRLTFELEVARTNLDKAREQERLLRLQTGLTVEEARATLAYRTVGEERAREDLARRQRLAEEGLISKTDMKAAEAAAMEARLAMESARVALERAEEELASKSRTARFDLANAKANLEKTEKMFANGKQRLDNAIIKATKGGIVVYKKNWRGEKLKVGDQVFMGAPLVEIPELDRMEAVLQVNEVDIDRVKTGQKGLLSVEALPDLALSGQVSSVAGLAKELPGLKEGEPSGIRAFEVIVSLDGTDPRLKPGMTVVARLVTGEARQALKVPRLAVFEREGKPVIFVKKAIGFETRAIRTGAGNDVEVAVLQGLQAGERVALLDPEESASASAPPATTPPEATAQPAPPPRRERRGDGARGGPPPGGAGVRTGAP